MLLLTAALCHRSIFFVKPDTFPEKFTSFFVKIAFQIVFAVDEIRYCSLFSSSH